MREVNFEDLNRQEILYNIADKLTMLYEKDIQAYVVSKDNMKRVFKLTKKEMQQIEKLVEE